MSRDAERAKDPYLDEVDPEELIRDDQLRHTPRQHQRLKRTIHESDRFPAIRRSDRRYLVIGRGGGEPADRRDLVRETLDERIDATAFMLEDFGLTGEDLDLWAPAFDILTAMSSHVVGVLEDFDGGHVWELGYLYRSQRHVRDILWLLKRVYEDNEVMRARYDNGMAASHLAALERAAEDRVIGWSTEDELIDALGQIP